ncbi:hypothetical protein D8B26_003536 [Coccidioides posadasii str. Silveira]|nr:hypothetical protein D8B26_003536 [Coccidioides posadasii str. Silveira]
MALHIVYKPLLKVQVYFRFFGIQVERASQDFAAIYRNFKFEGYNQDASTKGLLQ